MQRRELLEKGKKVVVPWGWVGQGEGDAVQGAMEQHVSMKLEAFILL